MQGPERNRTGFARPLIAAREALGLVLLAALAAVAPPGHAQEAGAAPDAEGPPQPAAESQSGPEKEKHSFLANFTDPEDGKLDFSKTLSEGGFFPLPVIITEPAVDGGFGIIAQFVSMPDNDPTRVTRRMAGGIKTGNGSYGYGYFQSGHALDGKLSYKFGFGRGKITLDTYPGFAPSGIEYTNKYKYGIFGSALWHLPDKRFSVGPVIDFRKLTSRLDLPGLPDEAPDLPDLPILPDFPGIPDLPDLPDDFVVPDFNRTLKTGALGAGFHFDSRDNAITPTNGVNAFVEGKFNSDTFGSDRKFQIYDADVYAFRPLSPKWRLGVKTEVDAARGDYPSYFAPSIDLRGVQAGRFQGETVLSSEAELTYQLSERWSLVGFAGYGTTWAGSSRVFDDSGAVFSGGAGFRYRLARKLGIDAGLDLAVGPDGTIVYIQFGHAWSFGMD